MARVRQLRACARAQVDATPNRYRKSMSASADDNTQGIIPGCQQRFPDLSIVCFPWCVPELIADTRRKHEGLLDRVVVFSVAPGWRIIYDPVNQTEPSWICRTIPFFLN